MHLVTFILLFGCWLSQICVCTVINYAIEEEKPAGFPVGSVIVDADFATKYKGHIPSILRFSLLESSPYFMIDPIKSNITTMQALDREVLCIDEPNSPCILTIDVVVNPNEPEHFQMLKVQITILDVNDNSPLFPQPIKDLYIPEGTPINTSIYLPTASDRDSDVYGVKEYELESHTQAFRVRSSPSQYGGTDLTLVLVRTLDRELQGSYTLKLVARDFGSPQRSGMMLLNVTVGDENDNSPYFQQPIYHVRVPESAQPGIMLTRAMATDRDSGVNGQIRYSISSRTNGKIRRLFRMDENTGELFLLQKLDYEDDKSFLIPITASDSGIMPRMSQSVVNITIADENDNYPAITVRTVGSSKAQVIEHSPNGTFIANVRVTDRDSGSNGLVTCIISSPYFLLSKAYENEYNLVVNTALDREKDKSINVTILCSDGGSPQKVSREFLSVTIIDVNDQEPTFDRFVYYVDPIEENNKVGAAIVKVKALDQDAESNGEVQYELGEEFDATYFSVDKQSGLITARTQLDREDRKDYTFSVLAIDKGSPPLTATAAVYVTLKDVNDNPPVFNMSHYRMSIAENMPKYSFVGKVSAYDRDARANGKIWFRVVNASQGPFIIEHDTGIVSTRVPLDRERSGSGQYQIIVVAADYGMPSLSTQVTINIDVIDENDNVPIVTSQENATLTCSYQTPPNTSIGSVKAYDADHGENGRLAYFIQSGNQYKMFAINKRTGEVVVAKNIGLEMVGLYWLEIGVQDNGLPPNTVFSSIYIQVTKEAYVPANQLTAHKPREKKVYNVNVIVVVVLSSVSGVLSLILIAAIIRIKRQTKENHSYNCRAEAQKLFNHSGRCSEQSRPSCGSSWGGLSSTDRSSVFSRSSENEATEPLATQTFLTTFSAGNQNERAVAALQNFDKNNLTKCSASNSPMTSAVSAHKRMLVERTKESDSDSGNCDDICSVHNSTPVLSSHAHSTSKTQPNNSAQQSFHSRFLSTAGNVEDGGKVPSSISSGNNSLTTNSSHRGSPAISHDSSNNKKQSNEALGPVERNLGHCQRAPPQESESDTMPQQNTSDMSDQTINGDRLCARIDELFFADL